MRLFSSSDKHSLKKVRSQHLVQVNLVADRFKLRIDIYLGQKQINNASYIFIVRRQIRRCFDLFTMPFV